MIFKKELPTLEVITHPLAMELLNQNHCIIAGTTGSGKSTLLDTVLYNLCTSRLNERNFFIVDLKRISLLKWEQFPHCRAYARTPQGALEVVRLVSAVMDRRFEEMERDRLEKYIGGDLYLVIDEAADLLSGIDKTTSKEIIALLTHIMRLGRAARVHCIYCTQAPDRKTIPSAIQQNANCAIGLRCRSRMESRQVIGENGCELLPRYGYGLIMSPDYMKPKKVNIPLIDPVRVDELRLFWCNK